MVCFRIFFLILIFISCDFKNKDLKFLPESNGNIKNITVIIEDKDKNGNIGNSIRENFQKPFEGLPFDEPEFTLNYMIPKAFKGFFRNSRNIIIVERSSDNAQKKVIKDVYAKPQIVAIFSGKDENKIIDLIKKESQYLVRLFNQNEFKEKKRRILKDLHNEKNLYKKFNVSLTYPSAYKTVKDTSNFIWIEKKITNGSLNIILYSLPMLNDFKNFPQKILNIRDSIGKIYVPGRLDGSYMITERAYRPFYYKSEMSGQELYITKGTWEVKNDFMAGPFLNYSIKDSVNKRWIIAEGFTFAPSKSKRDYMFELETILKSITFN
mgnify:FL=1|tara:strand:- start:258 stop:1226 length:969 start_codon:yes stop_codon:yes gene_type:complete